MLVYKRNLNKKIENNLEKNIQLVNLSEAELLPASVKSLHSCSLVDDGNQYMNISFLLLICALYHSKNKALY